MIISMIHQYSNIYIGSLIIVRPTIGMAYLEIKAGFAGFSEIIPLLAYTVEISNDALTLFYLGRSKCKLICFYIIMLNNRYTYFWNGEQTVT